MQLCETCRNVSVETLTGQLEDVPGWWAHGGDHSDTRGMVHLKDACQLKVSATTCPLCALIRDAILQYNANRPLSRAENHDGPYSKELWDVANFEDQLIHKPIYLRPKRDFLKRAFPEETVEDAWFIRGITTLVPVEGAILKGQIRLSVPSDSPLAIACNVVGRPALPSSDCPEAYDLIRRWMSACIDRHKLCRQTFSGATVDENSPPILPTRIVDVGPADGSVDPRLVETHGETAYYAALSHCWGPPDKRPLVTTKATLTRHISGISWSDIPLTYRHAMQAIRQLGLRYLWIDSLCIVQDDHDDWLRESKRMGSVYEQARVTIAASHAAGSSEGCFFERPERPRTVELSHVDGPGTNNDWVSASPTPDKYVDISPEYGPLAFRAWCTQEWLLSRRMIFYTKGSLVWSCKVITQHETGGSFHSTARNPRWKNIVEKYSARLLTNATDRLIALEGLRQELQKKLQSPYCFGLWKSGFPDQLLWYCAEAAERSLSELELPTWTWASTMRGVRFLNVDKAKNVCKRINFHEKNKTLTIQSQMKRAPLIRMAADTKHESVGALDEFLTDARYSSFNQATRKLLPLNLTCAICNTDGEVLGWGILDEAESEATSHSSSIFCLALMSRKAPMPANRKAENNAIPSAKMGCREDWVMLLREVTTNGHFYERIGVGKILWQSWFKDEPLQRICIR